MVLYSYVQGLKTKIEECEKNLIDVEICEEGIVTELPEEAIKNI